ncbi:MAG: ACT domain-containing protein [bacterium]
MSMNTKKKFWILFSVGRDRPGIVDDISTVLHEGGGNIEDSRMAVLGGCFSVMTLFSCTPGQLESIRTGLERLHDVGLQTSLHEARDPAANAKQPGLPLRFEITAMDHPGIVRKVVHLLHSQGVNIESLDTQVSRAPLSGAPLFSLILEATVPAEKPIAGVKEQLEALARDMNLDLVF